MYDVLSQYCTGEALSVIKGVTSFEGFLSWQKLHRKYNPKTMARAIRLMTDVTGPKQVKEIREVEAAIKAWETRVRKLESEFGESLTSTMKIAIVTGMMPTSIQDYVYTNVDGQTEYPAVVARIRTWAENKAAMMNGPVPMEVGEVQWELYNDEWEDAEVQAVGPNTQCHRCTWPATVPQSPRVKGRASTSKAGRRTITRAKAKATSSEEKGSTSRARASPGRETTTSGQGQGLPGRLLELREGRT